MATKKKKKTPKNEKGIEDLTKKSRSIPWLFGEKHQAYIRRCKDSMFNFAEGAVRAGKTIDNIFAFANELKDTPDRIHLASGSTVGNAKLNLGDANGFGLEHIFRGQCRWSKYRDNEALIIRGPSTMYLEKIIIFVGGAKSDSYKKFRGNSYGMWIATEVNLHHHRSIKEAFNRTAASHNRKIFWDLNPDHPNHWIYTDYIEKYRKNPQLNVNYEHFTMDDNESISQERLDILKSQYDVNTVWYRRDVLGLRSIAEGLIYQTFADTPEEFLVPKPNPHTLMQINIGVDFGGNKSYHAFVATGILRGFKGIIVLSSKRHEPKDPATLEKQFVEFVKSIIKEYGKVTTVYADSAEQVLKRGLQKALTEEGLGIKVNNSIKSEINNRIFATNYLLSSNNFGYTEDCKSLVEALEMAVWEPENIQPIRLDDGTSDIDTLDAFEYSFEKYIKAFIELRERR